MAERGEGPLLETGGPGDRILHWAEVKQMTGLSRSTTWRMQRTGAFPRSIALSPGRVGWWESELAAWRKARGAGRFRPPAAPRLPGTARRARPPEPTVLAAEKGDTDVADREREPVCPAPKPIRSALSSKRRPVHVHPSQIDFGF